MHQLLLTQVLTYIIIICCQFFLYINKGHIGGTNVRTEVGLNKLILRVKLKNNL